jgi:hypothetical protein
MEYLAGNIQMSSQGAGLPVRITLLAWRSSKSIFLETCGSPET